VGDLPFNCVFSNSWARRSVASPRRSLWHQGLRLCLGCPPPALYLCYAIRRRYVPHFSAISTFPARAISSTPSRSCCIRLLATTTTLAAAACTPPPSDHHLPAYYREGESSY